MSDLNELFAEMKNEIAERVTPGTHTYINAIEILFELDDEINNGEFARAERDAYIG